MSTISSNPGIVFLCYGIFKENLISTLFCVAIIILEVKIELSIPYETDSLSLRSVKVGGCDCFSFERTSLAVRYF